MTLAGPGIAAATFCIICHPERRLRAVSRKFTIGRDRACDVPIFDDSVSRLHAEIWLADDGSLMMADRGSVNGTTLVRGKSKFPLNQDAVMAGDYVRMGGVMLSVGEIIEAIEVKQP